MLKVAVLVSGGGTNLQAIIDAVNEGKITNAEISLVISNNKNAYALERAKNAGIASMCISPKEYATRDDFHVALTETLKNAGVDLVVLAGYLVAIPEMLVKEFPNKIINIHPALLPKYGGKGFYGEHVHEAVVAAKEEYSGITIHYVNEHYDSGDIIFQAQVALEEGETPDSLAAKIHTLEYKHYPEVIEKLTIDS